MRLKRKITKACPNKECSKYNKRFRGNIIKFGTQKNGNPRYKCTTCGKTFAKTKNTPLFYKHLKKEEVVQICRMLAKKMSFRKISRKTNRHLDTIRGVVDSISDNYYKLKDYFSKDLKLSKKESKDMIEFIKHKKAIGKKAQKTVKK